MRVKFPLKFLVFAFIIFVSSQLYIVSAEGQADESLDVTYAQTIVRDSEGILVTYLETSRINVVDSSFVEKIINDDTTRIINSETIDSDNKHSSIVIFQPKPPSYDTEGTRGITFLGEIILDKVFINLGAWFQNDGYFLEPDDNLTVIWTAIKSLD